MGFRRSSLTVSAVACFVLLGPIQTARSSLTTVSQIAGSGTIELYNAPQFGGAGANFGQNSTTIFNGLGVGPFSTELPSISIDSGTAISGGMRYGVELQLPLPKLIRDLPGSGSASFVLENLFAIVLDADPYTLTFTADERLEAWSGTDWDFSQFSNPGSMLTISLSIDTTRNYDFYEFLAGTAIDPMGNPVFIYVGDYEFEQVAGMAIPEPSALAIWGCGCLVFLRGIRVRRGPLLAEEI